MAQTREDFLALDCLLSAVGSAQRVVFSHCDPQHLGWLWELLLHALENETSEVLSGRNELAVTELGHIDIDVPMVEPIPHLRSKNVVENSKIDDESCDIVYRAADRNVADIAM